MNDLDMHSVTDFILEDEASPYSDLDIGDPEKAYAETISNVLPLCEFEDSRLRGAFSRVYYPKFEGKIFNNVATKFLEPNYQFEKGLPLLIEETEPKILQEILDDRGYYVPSEKTPNLKFQELSSSEKNLLYLAYEHRLHEKFYGEYVLPTIFVNFKLTKDIMDSRGNLFKGKGSMVSAMIQDFESGIRIIGKSQASGRDYTDWKSLTPEEVSNIETFTDEIEEIYLKTGYYIDPTLLDRGNMGLLEDGRVVLLDTNAIKKCDPKTAHMEKASGERIGIYHPIIELRRRIETYRNNNPKRD